jgi:hypothetical protein
MEPSKLFICHASEDKDFARPLADKLLVRHQVFFDEYSLVAGDRLRRVIGKALQECDHGVVLLSPHFFQKQWPQDELDGLFDLEKEAKKIIIPIWRDVDFNDVQAFSPFLTSRLGIPASKGVEGVVAEIERTLISVGRVSSFVGPRSIQERMAALAKKVDQNARAQKLKTSREGELLIRTSAREVVDLLKQHVLTSKAAAPQIPLAFVDAQYGSKITGPRRLALTLDWNPMHDRGYANMIREKDDWDPDSGATFERFEFLPQFGPDDVVYWERKGRDFTASQVADLLMGVFLDYVSKEIARDEEIIRKRGH